MPSCMARCATKFGSTTAADAAGVAVAATRGAEINARYLRAAQQTLRTRSAATEHWGVQRK